MTVFYGDYLCSCCNKKGKLMHEIKDKIEKIVFPGETCDFEETIIIAECEYCNKKAETYIHILQKTFVGFANKIEKNSHQDIPDTQTIFKCWKNEVSFSPFKEVNFRTQPYKVGKIINLNEKNYKVHNVFRSEWVEKDLDIRLEHPRPDAYWYKVKDEDNITKWLKIENVIGENIFLSDDGIILLDRTEVIEEITDNPIKIKKILNTDWFGGRKIEAYQYVNGVRILVINHKEQVEMDIFEDTFEEAMAIVEENMELGVFNE